MIFRISQVFLLCLFSVTSSFASDNAIKVSKNEFIFGGTKISKYYGATNTWDYQTIVKDLDQFRPFKNSYNSDFPSANISWIYFDLLNPDALDLWVDFGSSRLNEIRLFRLDENLKAIDTLATGFDIGKDYRPLGSYKFTMPILASDQEKGKFLVGYYARSGLYDTHICFGTQAQLANQNYAGNTYSLLFLGIYIILFCYNMVLFFSLRDRVYLFYCINLIVIFFAASYAVNFPYVSMFFGEDLAQAYMGGWMWLLTVTTGVFTIQFFDLKKSAPFWYRILILAIIINIANAIGTLFLPLHITSSLAMLLLVVFYAVCSIIGYDQLRKKHPLAVLYLISWTAIFIGVSANFMVAPLGLFYLEICHYANYISASLEALLFSVALGKRYQLIILKEQKTAALLVKKNEELILANDSLDSFNYHVSHDLKTILINTISLNHMIKKYTLMGKTEKVIQISDRLDAVAKKGEITVKGFLSLAEAGKVKEKSQEKIRIIDAISELMESSGLEDIIVNYNTVDFEQIYFNPTAFDSIFLNLLTNSKKYTAEKPEVNISFTLVADKVQIIYSDNGIGVDLEQYASLLFSPFRRVVNDLDQEGSGIGLFLVKRIIDESGGTIVPQSESGKGLTFVITLPKEVLTPA